MDEIELTWTERDVLKKQLAQMHEREGQLACGSEGDADIKEREELQKNISIGERAVGELDAILEMLSVRKDNPDDD